MKYDKPHDQKSNEAYIGIVISQIKKTRKLYQKAEKETAHLFNTINFFFESADLQEIKTSAENADNLYEAITCYLQYGEYDLKSLENELFAAIPKDTAPAQD